MVLKLLLSSTARPLGFVLLLFSSFMFLSAANAETCDAALSKYYDMNLDALESLKKEKKTRVEKQVYKQIVREKKILEPDPVSFSIEEDEFTGDLTYRTNTTTLRAHVRSTCTAKNKLKKGSALNRKSDRVFLRKVCISGRCSYNQVYFVYGTASDKAIDTYYGINRAVVKGLGDVKFTTYDLDYDVRSYGTSYTFHLALNLAKDAVEFLSESDEDPLVRFYSKSGVNIDLSIPLSQLNSFRDGLDENDAD